MLVLSRRVGEKIVIQDAICVTVVAIKGDRVRLGVTAPESVRVDRWEVHERRRLPAQARAVAFDVDAASLVSLREALPSWEIERVNGATAAALADAWDPGAADLLVVGVRDDTASTLGLCRFLAFCPSFCPDPRQEEAEVLGPQAGPRNPAQQADTPVLVLVLPGQETFVAAALEAGAHSCLVLPIHAKEVASMLAHARAGNQPGRHTLNVERAQTEDCWRDDGGEG